MLSALDAMVGRSDHRTFDPTGALAQVDVPCYPPLIVGRRGPASETLMTSPEPAAEASRILALVAAECEAIKLIDRDAPLPDVLDGLLHAVERSSSDGLRCSVLLLDEAGRHLRHGAAPSLPQAYNEAIDGIAVGEGVGSCGTAAHRGTAVHVADIATDPLWTDFRELATAHGIRACWSEPVRAADGRVVATFACYYGEPREPVLADVEAIALVSRAVCFAIERSRERRDRRDDAERAARVLNAVIDQYLAYRREVFLDKTPAIASQRLAFEGDLSQADQAYEQFLASNNIGDFAAAKATLAATYQTTFAERLSVQAQLNQAARRLQTLVAQQAQTPAEVALQQDLNISAQDQVLQLRTEREQLLSRYTADAQPVRDIEARIAQLQQYVATGTAVGPREVRTGPNPVWTELESTRINTQAERDSLAARLAVLDRQLTELRNRQAHLTTLESENSTLAGAREVLTANIREFQQRESQSRADNALVAAGADNVTVIERAQPPAVGKSLKIPALAAVFLFAGFTALCIGLLRVFTRRGFTTPASVSRTLDMPVLAVAPAKGR